MSRRRLAQALSFALVAGAGAAVWSCGGDDGPSCGPGAIPFEDRCLLPQKLVVSWKFNPEVAPGFTSDGCLDVGATSVRVDLAGPVTESKVGSCPARQVEWSGLPAGAYTATVTPLDEASQPLVGTAPTVQVELGGEPDTVIQKDVAVPPEAWTRTMTGTFAFLVRFAGVTCPPTAASQVITVRIGGVATMRSTTRPPVYRLDGSQPVPCVMSSQSAAENAEEMPFGRAQVEVVGRDSMGAEQYRGTFETFVGAGRSNPILTFDVPSVIDAGVDAPYDAPTDI